MSLFDVIKYPISIPPTQEELSALPDKLFNKWIDLSQWSKSVDDTLDREDDPVQISFSYELCIEMGIFTDLDLEEILLLRKLIKEYDEPV